MLLTAGKGGVGRSTVAAAIALHAVRDGKRVLGVDVVNDGGLRRALDAVGPIPSLLELLELSPEQSLREYIRLYLRVPIPANRLGPISRIFDYVATAAPGVREILTIGKVAFEVKDGPWDLVVVDGPATGHLIELLAAADNLGELIAFGPLADQTGWISDLLSDPAVTGVVTVTLAQELPMSETFELMARLTEETRVELLGLVVNRVPPAVGPGGLDEAAGRQNRGRQKRGRKGSGRSSTPNGLDTAVDIVVQRAEHAVQQLDRAVDLELPITIVPDCDDPVEIAIDAIAAWERDMEVDR